MSQHSKRRELQSRATGREAAGHRPRPTRALRVASLFCHAAPQQRPAAAPGLRHRITQEV